MYMVATACTIIALALPVMEFIPFSANVAGAALTAFGVALITNDGLVALFALLITVGAIALIVYNLFL